MVGSGVVRAEGILSDDFESYNDGALSGQGNWEQYGLSCEVTSGVVICGPWETNYKQGTLLAAGDQYLDFMLIPPDGPFNEGIGNISVRNGPFTFSSGIDFSYYEGEIRARVGEGNYYSLSANEWHTAHFQWNVDEIKSYIDDELIGTTSRASYPYDLDYIWFSLNPNSEKSWQLKIDNISSTGGTPPVIEGYSPILTPTFPVRNTENFVDFSEIAIDGKIEIPTGNDHLYHTLVITFRKPDNFLPAASVSIDVGDLAGGQSYQYHATTTIPITSSGDNFFKIGYSLLGSTYAGSYANNSPIVQELLAFDNTWIKDSASAAPTHLISQSIKPSGPEMEDCSIYSGTDKAFCEFRNFITGAFMPSDEALGQIGATMSSLKNKFPMNYINAISATFSNIKDNINDEAEISFHILGKEGVVNTDVFERDLGGGITLGQSFKFIFTFIILVIFMYWGIGYMHRILKF